MRAVFIRTQVLILAAYFLAAVLPVLAMTKGHEQSRTEHAQMMAMAGHLMQTPASDMPEDDTQQMLCQQHCLFAAAALPVPVSVAKASPRYNDAHDDVDILALSRAIAPPWHPPKVHVI